MLSYSEIESKRFGLRVYRGILEDIVPEEILSVILNNSVDVAIIRIPSEKQGLLASLERTGLPLLVTDTLVYYHVDLNTYEPHGLRNKELEFVEFHGEHFEIMDQLVAEIFLGYKNHYSSNRLLDVDLIEAYKEWARSYAADKVKGRRGWLVKREGRFVGFATCSFEGGGCEIVLNGVIPSACGSGIYSDLVRFIQRFFKNEGFASMKVSTQVENYAAQKVWAREGFFLNQAFFTVHINSLMNVSKIDKKTFDLTISADNAMKYNALISKMNCSYFDNDDAQREKTKADTASLLLVSHVLSRYYSEVYPGADTVLLACSYKLLKPFHLDRNYSIEIAFPVINSENNSYILLAKILDSSGTVCLFIYFRLAKK